MGSLVQVCFDLIVAGVVLYIVWIVLGMIPMLAPFKTIVMLVFTLICVVVLFNILSPLLSMGFGGGGLIGHRTC